MELGYEVELDAVDGAGQRHAAQQQHRHQQVGRRRRHVHHLQGVTGASFTQRTGGGYIYFVNTRIQEGHTFEPHSAMHLSRSFDALADAGVNDNPGEEQYESQIPANRAHVLNSFRQM